MENHKGPIIGNSKKGTNNFSPIDATGNSIVVKEWTGSGPEYLHVHYEDDEAWHILEGTITFRFKNNETKEFSAGDTVFVPAGVPHTYYETNGEARYLIILTPRLDKLIQELHGTPFDQHNEVMKKYKSEIVK
jgi:quercetin dioxygenase-like cupin family protein